MSPGHLLLAVQGALADTGPAAVLYVCGLILLAFAAWLVRCSFKPREERPRWGKHQRGPHMSRFGVIAWAFALVACSAILGLYGSGMFSRQVGFAIFTPAAVLVFAAAVHDWVSDSMSS